MGSNKTVSKYNAETRRQVCLALVFNGARVLYALVVGLTIVGTILAAGYLVGRLPPEYAGRQTSLELTAQGLFKIFASKSAYLLACALMGSGCWIRGRALKNRIAKMSQEKKELEGIIDVRRSTSGMNKHGTRPERT